MIDELPVEEVEELLSDYEEFLIKYPEFIDVTTEQEFERAAGFAACLYCADDSDCSQLKLGLLIAHFLIKKDLSQDMRDVVSATSSSLSITYGNSKGRDFLNTTGYGRMFNELTHATSRFIGIL